MYDRLSELASSESAIPGMSTGLRDLDRAISGLNRSDLILLAARPGMGKTSMALNILLEAGKKSGKNVAFFSLEMSREQLALRLISSECFVDNKKLVTASSQSRTGRAWPPPPTPSTAPPSSLTTTPRSRWRTSTPSAAGWTTWAGHHRLSPADAVRRRKARAGENRQQIVSDISRSLKIMAKELNVPVLCLSQLSRANESRQDKRPMLSDLRESGAIEQDADIVLFLYREGYYNRDTENPTWPSASSRKPPRGDRHHRAPVDAGVHHLQRHGVATLRRVGTPPGHILPAKRRGPVCSNLWKISSARWR